MPDSADLLGLIRDHGITILTPLAVIEGPVVAVIAGYLVSLKLMALRTVVICLVLADLAGDMLVYALGRFGRRAIPFGLLRRFGLTRLRVARMVRGFRARGTRFLVIGKLTHAAGFAVLLAAGMVRMNFARFMAVSVLTTVPKVLALVTLGHVFGAAWLSTTEWPGAVWLAMAAAAVGALMIWRHHRLHEAAT